jgi:hypothetical protein
LGLVFGLCFFSYFPFAVLIQRASGVLLTNDIGMAVAEAIAEEDRCASPLFNVTAPESAGAYVQEKRNTREIALKALSLNNLQNNPSGSAMHVSTWFVK